MKRWRVLLFALVCCSCVNGTPTATPVPTWTLPPPPCPCDTPTRPPSPTALPTGWPTGVPGQPTFSLTHHACEEIGEDVTPTPSLQLVLRGKATWYGEPYIGRHMKNGQVYTGQDMTCAVSSAFWDKFGHKTARICLAKKPDRCIEVQVTDTGDAQAFAKHGVVVDLSIAAFQALGLDLDDGVAEVQVWMEQELR